MGGQTFFGEHRVPRVWARDNAPKNSSLKASPFSKRQSLVGIKNLPKPPTPLRKIIEDAVY